MAKYHLLMNRDGDVMLQDEFLMVMYPAGDCDYVNKNMKNFRENLHRALYDAYQCSDTLKDGDEFVLFGRVQYRCEHVHVVEVMS